MQKNTFNMRQVTLENIADGISDTAGSKIAIKAAKMHGRNVVNAAKSLDLLRQNIQSAINNDIDRVVKKYLDVSFKVYSWIALFFEWNMGQSSEENGVQVAQETDFFEEKRLLGLIYFSVFSVCE